LSTSLRDSFRQFLEALLAILLVNAIGISLASMQLKRRTYAVARLMARLDEQAAQIQKVSAEVEMSRTRIVDGS